MMISAFSSYLEFLAAIYTSMYFDKIFDFWSPKYKNNLKEALEKNNWTKDDLFSSNLESACGEWYNGVRKTMLNKAAFKGSGDGSLIRFYLRSEIRCMTPYGTPVRK